MKLVWHIFLKDLRRFALPLGLLVLLMAGEFFNGWLLLNGDGVEAVAFSRMAAIALVFIILEVAANFFLVALLISEDPVRTTSAFWLTRPISGGRLLAAKLLGIVAMCGVLPVLVSLPWWLFNGYGAHEVMTAAGETLCWHALVVAVPLLLSVLTDSLPRLMLWSGVVAAVFFVWWLFAERTMAGTLDAKLGIVWTRAAVSLALAALGIAVAVVLQYRTRRIARSLAITAGMTSAILVVAAIWPWDWFPAWQRIAAGKMGAPIVSLGEHPTLHFEYRAAHVPALARKSPEANVGMEVNLVMRGMPVDRALGYRVTDQTWSWPDGTSLKRGEFGLYQFFDPVDRLGDLRNPATRAAVGLPQRVGAPGESMEMWCVVPRASAERMAKEPPAYAAEITYAIGRPVVLLESPLAPGGRQRHGAFSARVTDVEPVAANGAGSTIHVVASQPAFALFDAMMWRMHGAFRLEQIVPLQVDRRGEGWIWSMGQGESTVIIGTVAINWMKLRARLTRREGRIVRAITLADSAIVWMTLRDEERYRQTLRDERFELTPPETKLF